MTTPTETLEWASNASAQKEETTAKQKTHGWTTSDDTITGTAPRPVLTNQNWWQDKVSSYIKFAGDNLPEIGPVDLWEWDTANLGQLDTQTSGAALFIDDIAVVSGKLVFQRDNQAQLGDGDPWLDFQPETQYGGLHFEFQDMFSRGISIRLVDGNGVTWTIFNPLQGLDDFATPAYASLPEGFLTSGSTRVLTFTIDNTSDNVSIEKIEDGVTSFPSDFTGFVPLDISNFATRNPQGIRAILYAPADDLDTLLATTVNGISSYKVPKRRWIRPGLISKTNKGATPNLQWPIAWEPGKRYSVNYRLKIDLGATPLDGYGVVYADPLVESTAIHGYGTSSLFFAIDIHFEFTGPFQVARKGISFSNTNVLRDDGSGGNMDTMYPDLQISNILTVEEIE